MAEMDGGWKRIKTRVPAEEEENLGRRDLVSERTETPVRLRDQGKER